MMRDPGNLTLTMDYVNAAKAKGDLEGAIGALSRLLLIDPNWTQVQLQLAELYLELKSYAMAESFYRRVLASPVDSASREDAMSGLTEVADAQSDNDFALTVGLGAAYQTNANAGPTSTARILGVEVTPFGKAAPVADGNLFLTAALAAHETVGWWSDTTWDTAVSIFATRQLRLQHENIAYTRIDSGPSIVLQGWSDAAITVHPYLLVDIFGLGSSLLFASGGGGISVDHELGDGYSVRTTVEVDDRVFRNGVNFPTATSHSAVEVIGSVKLSRAFGDDDKVSLRLQAADNVAVAGWARYTEWRVNPTFEHQFTGLWGDEPWLATVEGARAWIPYARPDSSIDPSLTRYDREWTASVSLSVPIESGWSVDTAVSRTREESSLPNYRYTNTIVSADLAYSF